MARLLIVEDNAELAALIASAVQSRGHSARVVHGGAAALAAIGDERPDLAIVDLLLPDVSGREVLIRLRELAVAAIAVSGVYRGSKYAAEATQALGAKEFFEKPFDMRSLLDAIDRIAGAAQPAAAEDEEDLDALEELSPIEDDDEDEPIILPGPPEASREPPRQLPPPLPARRPPPAPGPPAPKPAPKAPPSAAPAQAASAGEDKDSVPEAEVLTSESERVPLPFAERERVWAAPRDEKSDRAAPGSSQAGPLRTTSVPRLLTAYYQARHNGELKLRQGQMVKVVLFGEGQPIYAASNVASERFARFCVRKGAVRDSQAKEAAEIAKRENARTGEVLVRLGVITAERRHELVEQQMREILWSTFGWRDGEYAFSPKVAPREGLVPVKLFPGKLVLEGIAHTEPLVSLRQRMPPSRRLIPSADPPYALNELELSGPQAMLIAYADGTKSVEDLLAVTDLPEKDALATLLAYELLGLLVERRDEPKRARISFGV